MLPIEMSFVLDSSLARRLSYSHSQDVTLDIRRSGVGATEFSTRRTTALTRELLYQLLQDPLEVR
jgi:hypothetical protein